MWRDTSRTPKLFFFDGSCITLPFLVFCLHMSKATLIGLVVVAIALELLRRRGINHKVLFWSMRQALHGGYRPTKVTLRTYKRRARW